MFFFFVKHSYVIIFDYINIQYLHSYNHYSKMTQEAFFALFPFKFFAFLELMLKFNVIIYFIFL